MGKTSETKAEKFVRLKNARLEKVLDGLRILENTANPKDYEYTEEQAREVVETLHARVDELARSFGLEARPAAASNPVRDGGDEAAMSGKGIAAQSDAGSPDPRAVQSNIKEIDGKPLKVKPGDWDQLMLLQVGPHLGLAMEAVMDGDNETALELLKKVMTA